MSLDKAIQHGKERRKEYTDSRLFDSSCRNHGGCEWCKNNRTHSEKMRQEAADEKIKEWRNSDE